MVFGVSLYLSACKVEGNRTKNRGNQHSDKFKVLNCKEAIAPNAVLLAYLCLNDGHFCQKES